MKPDPLKIGINISTEEYEKMRKELPFAGSSYDIVYAILMKRQLYCMANGSVLENYRVHFDLYNFFQVEKRADRAVQELIYALYYIVNDQSQETLNLMELHRNPRQCIGLNNFHVTYLSMHIDEVPTAINNCISIVLPGNSISLDYFRTMVYNTISKAKFDPKYTYDDDYYARRGGRDLSKEQYDRYKQRLGDKFNYTFEEFIKMKSDKKKWDNWKKIYRQSK